MTFRVVQKSAPPVPSRSQSAALGLLIFAIAVLVYTPAMTAGFIWDDDREVTANPLLRSADGLWRFWFAPPTVDYFPLKSSVQWLLFHFCGPDPVAFHLLNIGLHGLNAVLLWRLLLALRVSGAFLGALLFAVHPVCVDSVAWISELKNTLSLGLMLLSLRWYLRFDEMERRRDYAASLLGFAMALLAKSAVVPMPLVLLLCCAWRRSRISRADVLRTAPFFALSLVLGIVTIVFQNSRAIGQEVIPIGGLFERVAGASLALGFYLWKALWPVNLMAIYPDWHRTLPIAAQLIPAALLMIAGIVTWRRAGRAALFALGCFIAMLLPVLGLMKMSYLRVALVSDHFAYFALPAVTALVGALFGRLRPNWLARLAALGLVLAMSVLTWRYAAIFQSEESLWRDTLAKNPGSWMAHNRFGSVLFMKGRVAEALPHFTEAVRLKPDNPEGHHNVGLALAAMGRPAEAIPEYQIAVAIQTDDPFMRLNFANALTSAGRTEEAMEQFRAAAALAPREVQAQYALAAALVRMGDPEAARKQIERILALAPGHQPALQLRAQIGGNGPR